jgi:acyl-CoA dehydrogenase
VHTTRRKPVLTQWDAWGRRIDRIELTTAWQEGPHITTRHAVLAAGHEANEHARLEEFARVYLYHVASEFYTCPLAMTDGAATAIKASGNRGADRAGAAAFPQSRRVHVLAQRPVDDRERGRLRCGPHRNHRAAGRGGPVALYGRKWFSSAVSAKRRWRSRVPKAPAMAPLHWRCFMSKRWMASVASPN